MERLTQWELMQLFLKSDNTNVVGRISELTEKEQKQLKRKIDNNQNEKVETIINDYLNQKEKQGAEKPEK